MSLVTTSNKLTRNMALSDLAMLAHHRKHFIPTTDTFRAGLLSSVMNALVQGLTKNPQDAIYFDFMMARDIVEIVSTTFAYTRKFNLLIGREWRNLIEVSDDMYDVISEAGTQSIKATPELRAKVIADYANALIALFKCIGEYRFSNAEVYPENNKPCVYKPSVLMQRLRRYSKDMTWCKHFSSNYSPDNDVRGDAATYFAPTLLGRDVLTYLAYQVENRDVKNALNADALKLQFGRDFAVYDADGYPEYIEKEFTDEVKKLLWPHQKWFTDYMLVEPDWINPRYKLTA